MLGDFQLEIGHTGAFGRVMNGWEVSPLVFVGFFFAFFLSKVGFWGIFPLLHSLIARNREIGFKRDHHDWEAEFILFNWICDMSAKYDHYMN